MTRRAYEGTGVPVTQSRDEIEHLLERYGAMDVSVQIERPEIWREDGDRRNPQQSEGGAVVAEFQWPSTKRACRMRVEIADEAAESAGEKGFRARIDQEMRIKARSLYYRVKATMESISSGDMSPTAALFPYFVLPKQGITVAEKPDHELEWLIESNQLQIPATSSLPEDHHPTGPIYERD